MDLPDALPSLACDDASLGEAVTRFIRTWLDQPGNNNLGPGAEGKAWEDVLVGFSSGTGPVWGSLKEHVAPFHWTPAEAFALGAPSSPEPAPSPCPADLTVISWALCQSEAARAENRAQTLYPAEAWARSRMFGQECNVRLHRALIEALVAAGHQAVAPALLPEWVQQPSPRYGLASSWSERHVAYACGLGTFGLTGGLITARGQAIRLGSVLVRARISPTPHAYEGPFDYCLFLSRGLCARCVARCPVGSVREEGRDKDACARHLGPANHEYVETHYGFKGYACGLCQTGVPCENGIPEA